MMALAAARPAAALCSGETLEREYAAADLVVRARLVSETLVHRDERVSAAFRRRWGDDMPVMVYRIEVGEVYKGTAAPAETLFQVWQSGRFVMDAGQDYVLFLYRYPQRADLPEASQGASYVRHACGQSRRWAELDRETQSRLRGLQAGRDRSRGWIRPR